MRANRSVRGFSTSLTIARRSALKAFTLWAHARALDGAFERGQYPAGHAGETYFGFRLNARMSRCAMRICSRISQALYGVPGYLAPRSEAGNRDTPAAKLTCAPPPFSR